MIDPELIQRRRRFSIPGYFTLLDVGMDGNYVSPLQISSSSPFGPVLLAYHWLDAESAREHQMVLRECGYLPWITFNQVVQRALDACGMTRAAVYMTQVFHLLPPTGRSSYVPASYLDDSFNAITIHELQGRKVIALGTAAAATCQRNGVEVSGKVMHPSARGPGRTIKHKAHKLAEVISATLK